MKKMEVVIMTKFISMINYSVKVASDNESVYNYLSHEIGEYFKINDSTDSKETLRGEGQLITSKIQYKKIFDKYNTKNSENIILHDGSYEEDLRIGQVFSDKELTIIYSVHTKSFFKINNKARVVIIYNPDISFGKQDVRRVVRNQIFIPYIQSMGGIVVHGAAFANQSKGTLVMGSSGSGKTSVFMAALTCSDRYKYLSCERVILFPENNSVRIHSCPESITIFPGSLASFDQTFHLAANVSEDEYWQRENKMRLSWRKLFSEFNATACVEPVYLDEIIYPTYSQNSMFAGKVIDDRTKKELLKNNIMLTGVYENRPNWLGWYQIKRDKKLKENIIKTKCSKLTWSKTDELIAYFQDK